MSVVLDFTRPHLLRTEAEYAAAVAEIVGGSAHLIDSRDEGGWMDAMRRVIVDDDWRDALRRGAVARARPFTWRRCAEDTWRVYRAIAGHALRAAA